MRTTTFLNVVQYPQLDYNVKRFLSATGIKDPKIIKALDTYVKQLKVTGLWSKMVVIYPFVGGTALTNSYNLVNPSLYRITWSGTVTHDSNGITGNGTTGYGDTGFTVLSQSDMHMSTYVRNNIVSGCAIGASEGLSAYVHIFPRFGSNLTNLWINQTSGLNLTGATNAQGLWIATRDGAASVQGYRNTTQVQNDTASSVSPTNDNLTILVRNDNGSTTSYASFNIALTTIGSSFTSTQIVTFNSLTQQFQKNLSREV